MDPLRITLLAAPDVSLERLLADPLRGVTWELVDEGADYVLCAGREAPASDARVLVCGEADEHSAVHLLTPEGPRLLLLGPHYPLAPMAVEALERDDLGFLYAYMQLHHRWMRASWGDLLAKTLELLAGGTMQIVGDVVWFDGAPGPCRMGESPRVCHEPARGVPRSCPFIGG